jgi:hypothetical protein
MTPSERQRREALTERWEIKFKEIEKRTTIYSSRFRFTNTET